MRFFVLFFLCSIGLANAQGVMISGLVLDADSGEPLPYAHVILKGTERGTITNLTGEFQLEVEELPALLVVSEVAHETRFYRAIRDSVVIKLEAFSLELTDVTVLDKREPYFRMANEVLDFEFYDDNILILANSGREVRLLDHRGNILDIAPTPGKYKELFKDCLDNLHIVAEDTTWQVFYDYENIRFIHPNPVYLFDLYLRNCQAKFQGGLIYSLSRRRGLINSFLFAAGGSTVPFYEIGDTSALNYLETNYDLNFFIEQRRYDGRYQMSVSELEARLDQLQDDLVVDWFDSRIMDPGEYFVFANLDQLRIFSTGIMTEFLFTDLENEPSKDLIGIDERHLNYLTMDESSSRIYAVYKNGMGKVWAVDLDDPTEQLNIPEFAFPTGVKVRDSYLFFVVDPALNGSNILMRKNTQFGEDEGF
jgi:hypothetical protein